MLLAATVSHREHCCWSSYLQSVWTLDVFSFNKCFNSKNWDFYHTKGNHRWKQIFQVIFSNSFSRWKNWSEITDAFGMSSVTELVIEGRDYWQCISRLIFHTLFFPTTTQPEFYFYFSSEQKQPNWSYPSIYSIRGFFLFFFPTCQERRNTLVLFHPFLGRFWFSSQERMCLHLSRCVHTGGAHLGLEQVRWIPWGWPEHRHASAVALDRLVPWKANWKPALTKWAKRVTQGYKCAQRRWGGSDCHGVLDMQGCLGLLLKDWVCCHWKGFQSCLGIHKGNL